MQDVNDIANYSDEEVLELQTETPNLFGTLGIFSSSFKDFFLRPELTRAVTDAGFEHPSPVQTECIPQAILGTDVLCQAKSGTGKTGVFVLSILQQLGSLQGDEEPRVACIVLCHARELAFQIQKEFTRMKKYLPLRTAVVYGGVPLAQDKKTFQVPPHILIGTPGRVLHLARDGILKLGRVKHFVLDECDKMLEATDMRKTVQDILKFTPHNKQVMMFSATLSPEIRALCKKFMHHVGQLALP